MSKLNMTVANANMEGLTDYGRENIFSDVKAACARLLEALCIDAQADPQTKDTAERMARMYVNELMYGRYFPKPDLREFPNIKSLDQLYAIGPVAVNSLCAHHMLPFIGQAWLGMVPGVHSKLLGLSKFARLTNWIFARPQIQEEATVMLADEIEEATKADGVAVIVKAQHLCMAVRGVKDQNATMTTSVMRGLFLSDAQLRAEFLALMKQ